MSAHRPDPNNRNGSARPARAGVTASSQRESLLRPLEHASALRLQEAVLVQDADALRSKLGLDRLLLFADAQLSQDLRRAATAQDEPLGRPLFNDDFHARRTFRCVPRAAFDDLVPSERCLEARAQL